MLPLRWKGGPLSSVATTVAGILLGLCISTSVLAQAGSTGGSVGKTDKSVSGDAPQRKIRPEKSDLGKRPATSSASSDVPASPCLNAVGTWTFSNGISVVHKAWGAAAGSNGDSGDWSCAGSMITVHWANWTDHYAISSQGRRLSGTSGFLNMSLTAEKK
jgi:hypothetical protein